MLKLKAATAIEKIGQFFSVRNCFLLLAQKAKINLDSKSKSPELCTLPPSVQVHRMNRNLHYFSRIWKHLQFEVEVVA